jgi:hypothetical protein
MLSAGSMCARASNVFISAHPTSSQRPTCPYSSFTFDSVPAPHATPLMHTLPAVAALRLLLPAHPLLASLTDAVLLAADVTLTRTKLGVRVEGPASQVALALGVVTGRVQALVAELRVHTLRGSCDMEARHLQVSVSQGLHPEVLHHTYTPTAAPARSRALAPPPPARQRFWCCKHRCGPTQAPRVRSCFIAV